MMMSNPMMDPNNMVEMMKGNTLMIVPQLFIMAGVNYFFSGFVLGKFFEFSVLTLYSEASISIDIGFQINVTKRSGDHHLGCNIC
jgi:hypothetical protein